MSHNTNCNQLRNKYRCSNCQKGYMSDDSKRIHQKRCLEREDAINRNSKRYSI